MYKYMKALMITEPTIETEKIVLDFIQGSTEACAQVITRFYGTVHNSCYCVLQNKDEADDATQETFLKMMRNIKQYDTNRKFKPWLYQIAINTARNILLKKRPRSFIEQEQIIDVSDTKSIPIDIITQKEQISKISTSIEKLSPELKIVILLKYQQDLENEEITQALNITPGTLRVRLFRAINTLRKKLNKGKELI